MHADEDTCRDVYAAHLARRAADYGVVLSGGVQIDMSRVKARADAVSANARAGVEKWLRNMDGCTVPQGHARFEGPDTVRVGEEQLTAPRIFINVGGRARVPDMPGVHDVPFLTNTTMLALDRVRGISSWSAAVMSASSSRRCSGALAQTSPSSKRRRG